MGVCEYSAADTARAWEETTGNPVVCLQEFFDCRLFGPTKEGEILFFDFLVFFP